MKSHREQKARLLEQPIVAGQLIITFCGARDLTRGSVHARQVPYHCPTISDHKV